MGDTNVGKTCLLRQYVDKNVPEKKLSTIGVEFLTKQIKLNSGAEIKAQLWDTAGQEKYRSLSHIHYRRAYGALLVYDITRRDSFAALDSISEELKNKAPAEI